MFLRYIKLFSVSFLCVFIKAILTFFFNFKGVKLDQVETEEAETEELPLAVPASAG